MDFDGPMVKLAVMHVTSPHYPGGHRLRLLAGLVLGVLLASWPARGTILWSHPETIQVCNNGAGVDILHGAIAPQDSNAQRTLYFRIRVDPVADSVIKSIGPLEAGFMFVEKGQEHLGIGNSLGAWAYCAMNVPKNKKGYEDFNSATPEPTHNWEYMRAGVPKYIAFKIAYRPAQDARVTVWLNPDLSGAANELNQPTNIITRFETTATFDEIRLVHRGEGAGWRFSEMVAGTSFDDLLLVPLWQRGWFIALAGGGSLVGVAGMVHWLERRRSRRQILRLEQERTVAAERARIARDIHDELGASLTKIFKLAEIMNGNPTAAATQAVPQTIAQTAREAIQTMDEIVWAVNPKNDTLGELADYLVYFTDDFLRPAGIACVLEVPLKLPATPITAEVRHTLLMLVKEALNNVVKHAGARQVRFGMEFATQQLTVEIADDGCGLPPEGRPAGRHGLENMRRRTSAIGGEISWRSRPGGGTTVKLRVPLPEHKTTTG
jgi:signal transduction histidine kinase